MFTRQFVFSAACMLLITTPCVQGQWINQTSDDVIRSYNTVCMVDSSTGWIGGFPSSILKTTDGGHSWRLRYSGGTQDGVIAIEFVNKSTGFAIGSMGNVGVCLKTIDGGEVWNIDSSMSKIASDSGFALVYLTLTTYSDTTIVWLQCFSLSGAPPQGRSYLYWSRDEGKTWNQFTKIPVPSSQIYGSVFPTSSTGLFIAPHSLFRTTNGGDSWSQYQIDSSGNNVFLNVRFLNADTGYFAALRGQSFSQPLLIGWTFDRGATWKIDSTVSSEIYLPGMIHFADTKLGFAVKWGSGSIFRTTDAGKTWEEKKSLSLIPLYSIHSAGGKTVVAAGNGGRIMASNDSGVTWLDLTPPGKVRFTYVKHLSPNLVVAIDYGNGLYLSTDSLTTWVRYDMPTGLHVCITFADSLNGWIADDSSRIYHTTNSGRTWTVQKEFNPADPNSKLEPSLNGIHFFDVRTGCAVGNKGFITATADTGRTWKSKPSNTSKILYGVFVASRTKAWAVGESGTIITTSDGCNSWSAQTCPVGKTLRSVTFLDTLQGYILGDDGTILNTTDGGVTWILKPSPGSRLNGMKFLDAAHGWVVGDSGKVFITLDGGNRWQSQQSGTLSSLTSVDFYDNRYGVVVGDSGIVLATRNGGFLTSVGYAVASIPTDAGLSQNFPNPFNPTTTLIYRLSATGKVSLRVHDLLGREVASLVDGRKEAGYHTVTFDASKLPSGIYFARFQAGNVVQTRKLCLVK